MHWIQRKQLKFFERYQFWENKEKLPKITIFTKVPIFGILLLLF